MLDEPKTERGRRTRDRIVAAAAALIERQGAEATGLDQVLAEANASKSQLYHYFTDKQDLVRAVIAWQTTAVIDAIATDLAASFGAWEVHIKGALDNLRDRGLIRRGADTARLATATLAAIQGGLLLAKTTRDPDRLRLALDAASAYLRSHGG